MEPENSRMARVLRIFFIKNLVTYFVLLLVPAIIFCIVASSAVERYVSDLVRSNTNTVFSISSASMESMLSDSMQIGIYVDNHPDIILALLYAFQGESNDNVRRALSGLDEYLGNFMVSAPYIHSVCLYKKGADLIAVGGSIRSCEDFGNEGFIEAISNAGSSMEIQRHSIKLGAFEERGTDVVTFITGLKYGIILAINIREADIWEMLDRATQYPQEMLVLADDSGEVITGNGWYRITDPIQEEDYLIQSHELLSGDYSLVSLIPDSVVHEASSAVFRVAYLVMALALAASAIISLILTRISYRRVNSMLKLFELNDGLADIDLGSKSGFDLYNYIIESIARSYVRETNLREKVVRSELQLTRTQLAALQYQINPHFIFNTLQMIDIAVSDDDMRSEASNMISLFSTILRYSIQDASQLVDLAEEISITKMYIRLQELRVGSRVIILWDYDDEDLDGLRILRMLFQPLLENIFQHGLHPGGERTIARIKLYRASDMLVITVSDNGPGMSRETLASIRSSLRADMHTGRHIGLYNVDRRLKLFFGEESGLNIMNIEGSGLQITISIPLDKIRNDTF